MKVLVTGGAGFIGSNIVDHLLDAGHEVMVVDDLSSGKSDNLPAGVPLIEANVTTDLEPLFAREKFDAVIHEAAQVSVPNSIKDPLHDLNINLRGLVNVLEACRKHGVGKIVFASSAAVYGTPAQLPIPETHSLVPLSPYGLTKKTAEEYLRIYHELHGLRYTILRYGNVYGPRQAVKGESGVIALFTDALCRGLIPTINGDGTDTRDYVFVGDIARANLLALTAGDGQTFNISNESAVTINQLFAALTNALGDNVEPKYGPPRPGDIQHSTLSSKKAQSQLGWKPTTGLAEGLQITVEWVKKHLEHR